MSAGTTLVSVEEYLRSNYEPACEYVDGVLHEKPMPTRKHGLLQSRFSYLLTAGFPDFEVSSEVTVQIREGKYLIPDVIVQRRESVQDPYPTSPVHLCIEILSPDDRMSEVLAKCEGYHAWGVDTTWIVDPETKRAWEYRAGERLSEVPAAGALRADGISIPLADVMAVL